MPPGDQYPPVKSLPIAHRHYDFAYPRLNMSVLVEVSDECVTIRMSRDGFSDERKMAFVHELAAEGFIPDAYMWISPSYGRTSGCEIRWVVDSSWMEPGEEMLARSRQFVFRIISYSVIVMVVFMGLLFGGGLGNVRVGPATGARHDFNELGSFVRNPG
jgi:hypothetical protein